MLAPTLWMVVVTALAVVAALGCVALGVACLQRRSERIAWTSELASLRDRVARLESRAAAASLAPSQPSASPADRPQPSSFASSTSSERPRPARPAEAVGPTLIAVPDLTSGPSSRDPNPGDDASARLEGRFGRIWDLADAGSPPDAIALATGQPIGQVELILGLRRQLAASGDGPAARGPFEPRPR